MSLSATLLFYGQLTKSGAGVTGKSGSLTATVKKLTRGSTPTITTVSTGSGIVVGSVAEVDSTNAKGAYVVGVSGLDPASDYLVSLHYTGTSTDVDLVDVLALQTEFSSSINAGAIPQVLFGAAGGVGDTQRFGGVTATGRDIGASVLLSPGTGTGQLDFTNGILKANLVQILTTTLTEAIAGQLAGGFKKVFDVTAPVFTAASVNQTGDSFAIVNSGTFGNAQLARTSVTATIANQTTILGSVNAITTNTARSAPRVPDFLVRPSAGSVTYTGDLLLYNLQGALEDADTNTVTVHARNSAGTSLDAGLTSTTMTRVSVGFYRMTYTVASTDTTQAVYFDFSWSVGAVAMKDGAATQVQDAESLSTLAAIRAKTDQLSFSGSNLLSSPQTPVILTDGSLTTAKLGIFVLAKTTNITGFNDIAAGTAMTVSGNVTVGTIVANAINAAAIAAGALNGKGDWLTLTGFNSAYTPPDNTDILALATMLEVDPSNAGKKRLTAAATANIAGGGGGGGGAPEWTLTGTSTSVDG